MDVDVLALIEDLSEHGQAPARGCSLFGRSNEEAIERIADTYLRRRFSRGGSAEKFVVGPYGSGKTHFLRQLMEKARELDCVTSEVALNKDVDFTQSLIVYKQVVADLTLPHGERGLKSLLEATIARLQAKSTSPDAWELVLGGWISALNQFDFKQASFGKVMQQALTAYAAMDAERVEICLRWLSGDVSDKNVSGLLGVPVVPKAESNAFGQRALLSLGQFARLAGFNGTVICYDEAEQGLNVDRRKTERVLSMLMAQIASMVTASNSASLVVYALTPDIVQKLETFAALQQRIIDPGPGLGFFDGHTLAPLIDLQRRRDPINDLMQIGQKLVDLFVEELGYADSEEKARLDSLVKDIAVQVGKEDISAGNRRVMVKRLCASLLQLVPSTGQVAATKPEAREDEV